MTATDFWSRRKAGVEAEQEAEALAVAETEVARHEAELAARSDEEILEELNLPDPDTLNEGDDFKAFMSKAVPSRLRTRALRRLWRVNPVLANIDGLVDYGEDFTDASNVIENLQTTYQVGKGMLAHVEELARQQEAREETLEEEAKEPEVEVEEPPMDQGPQTEDAPLVMAQAPVQEAETQEELAFIPQRRMRFAFDEAETQT